MKTVTSIVRAIIPHICVCLAAAYLFASCAYLPKFNALDGIAASTFVDSLTGTGGSRLQPPPGTDAGIKLTYLGTSGFLIERDTDVILLAPFLSHHSLTRLFLWRITPEDDLIDDVLRPMATTLDRAAAVLVGHSHYDHLLDIRSVVNGFAPNATVFGNTTMVNILAADPGINAVSLATTAERPPGGNGSWTPVNNGRVRFMAIQSHHAPNFAGLTIANRSVQRPLKRFPGKAGGMEEGETFAFMIDFMDTTSWDSTHNQYRQVAFRMYYQDAAESPVPYHTLQFNPAGGGRNVDVAIACVAVFTGVQGDAYPETMKQIFSPRQTVLSHWENFFRPRTTDFSRLRTVPNTDPVAFISRLATSSPNTGIWVLPIPGTTLTY